MSFLFPCLFIPGWDVSGVVEAVGSGVTKFKKGDEVYACPDVAHSGKGAYGEYLVAKETETALKPKLIDHVYAAAIPMVGLTAWPALFDTAALRKGQKILIHGQPDGWAAVGRVKAVRGADRRDSYWRTSPCAPADAQGERADL
jgi:D-arabinose 1-dehydrogenase-like Zn-dependent alcohol dehydrogenase